MPRSVFQRLLTAEPSLAIQLVTLLGRRLREAFDVIQTVSVPGARSRVASAFLGLLFPTTEHRATLACGFP